FKSEADPIFRARALWVASAIESTPVGWALKDQDPRIREQAVRILGRDCRENGQVEYQKADAKRPPLAAEFLDRLLPLANDPDAGVRRELILALRNVPTAQAGDALRTLAASWDGQDRWYLEALGLALRDREPEFIASLFDGSLYGPMDLENAGRNVVAVAPYFPTDRNEAYLPTGSTLPPASAVSKTLGLAWELHRVEALPLVLKMLPSLKSAELQQAADDMMNQVEDPAGAAILAEVAANTKDPLRQKQAMASLARKLDGTWRSAAGQPQVVALIESALKNPDTRLEGVMMAGGSGDRRYSDQLLKLAEDTEAPAEVRVEAIEAIARVKAPKAGEVVNTVLARAKDEGSTSPAAEAAVRALPRLGDARNRLQGIVLEEAMPLGVRREALRNLAILGDGGNRLVDLAKQKKIPEELRTETATVLRAHPDGRVRDQALQLFPIKTKSGQPLPSVGELVRRDGDADRGREVFFRGGTNACASCHRVQGQGQWIGPDLSTIGTKYGKDVMLRQILNPSEAISYNFHSLVLALEDGRVLTGLPVEDTPNRIVLKLADGQRVVVSPADVEARRLSEVSLMPEGLAEGLSEQDLVDLMVFLNTLRQPVSIVGEAQAVGPLVEN
ncbi:MAG TPA: HEAT repeat domain-containing protein, partial [Isosphaeraceae bacterium]|nr:HEAT repeat domain-containing protein [Isosphaeraceae bacterium]